MNHRIKQLLLLCVFALFLPVTLRAQAVTKYFNPVTGAISNAPISHTFSAGHHDIDMYPLQPLSQWKSIKAYFTGHLNEDGSISCYLGDEGPHLYWSFYDNPTTTVLEYDSRYWYTSSVNLFIYISGVSNTLTVSKIELIPVSGSNDTEDDGIEELLGNAYDDYYHASLPKDPADCISDSVTPTKCSTEPWSTMQTTLPAQLPSINVGDPVNILSGNFIHREIDGTLKSVNCLSIARIYNSKSQEEGLFGKGWSSPLFPFLKERASDMVFVNSNGAKISFKNTASGYANQYIPQLKLDFSEDTTQWTLQHSSGNKWIFNEDGKLLQIFGCSCASIAAATTSFEYDTAGNLHKISNNAGQWFEFQIASAYGENGTPRITNITDSTGRQFAYTYDVDGKLVSYVNPLGQVTGYEYNQFDYICKIIKPSNRVTTINYENDRVVSVTNPLGKTNNFVWDIATVGGSGEGEEPGMGGDEREILRKLIFTDFSGVKHKYIFKENGTLKRYVVPAIGLNKKFFTNDLKIGKQVNSLGAKTKFRHNRKGLLKKKIDALGNITKYKYHRTLLKLTKKTDALGREWNYEWCARGNLMSQTDPASHVTAYTYDNYNNRTSVTDPMGRVTKSIYDSTGSYLLKIINPASGTVSFTYDNRGNLLTTTDALNRVTTFEYDILDRLTQTIYPDSRYVVITYNEAGNIVSRRDNIGRETRYTYDLADRMLSVIYPDNTTKTYEYDAAGRKTSITDALGRATKYEYDAIGNLIKIIYADNTYQSFTYNTEKYLISRTDELGNTTGFEYDPMGRLIATIDAAGSRWEKQYDTVGRRVLERDPIGRNTQYVYDMLDRVEKTIYPDFAESTAIYDSVGNLLVSTDAMNFHTTYEYDNLDRTIRVVEPNGASSTTAFDAMGQVLSVTNSLGVTTNYDYDAGGRNISTTNALGETWHKAYDNVGRLITVVDPTNASYTFMYDSMNRVKSITSPLGAVIQSEYDAVGRKVSSTDPMGGRYLTAYDLRDRVISEVDPEGRIVSLGYNEGGQKVRLTEGAGRTHLYEYNNLGYKTAEINPLGHRTSYTYDVVGNMVSKINARGQLNSYDYNVMNLLSQVTYPDATIATFSYDLNDRELARSSQYGASIKTWDSVGNMLSEKFTPTNKTWNYTYDTIGNRIEAISPEGKNLHYKYDVLNRLVDLKATGSDQIKYQYDVMGRLAQTIRPGANTSYQYDANSQLLQIVHKSARRQKTIAKRKYSYDKNGNKLSEEDERSKVTHYAYDRAGWLNLAIYPNGERNSFAYNGAGDKVSTTIQKQIKRRLRRRYVVATQTSTIDYTYDAAGRMIAKGNDAYDYDNDGNLVKAIENGKDNLYSWNSNNQLTKFEKVISTKCFTKKVTEEYTYLPEEWRRLSRTAYSSFNCRWRGHNQQATTVKQKFFSVYDGQDESHEYWQTPSFARKAWRWGRFCWRPRVPKLILKREFIGGPLSDDLEISKYSHNSIYMLKDALGSTIALTNRCGSTIAKINYDAWGNFRYPNNNNTCRPFNGHRLHGFVNRLSVTRGFGRSHHDPYAVGKYFASHMTPYLYAGRRYNQLTGQYFNRNRYYQSKYGRFTSSDPIGFNGDINLYRYANNNPMTFNDPFGLTGVFNLIKGANGGYSIGAGAFQTLQSGFQTFVNALPRVQALREQGVNVIAVLGGLRVLGTAAVVAAAPTIAAVVGTVAVGAGIKYGYDAYTDKNDACVSLDSPFNQHGDNILKSEDEDWEDEHGEGGFVPNPKGSKPGGYKPPKNRLPEETVLDILKAITAKYGKELGDKIANNLHDVQHLADRSAKEYGQQLGAILSRYGLSSQKLPSWIIKKLGLKR